MCNREHGENEEVKKVVVARPDVRKDDEEQREMAKQTDVIYRRVPACEADRNRKYRDGYKGPQNRRVAEEGPNKVRWW